MKTDEPASTADEGGAPQGASRAAAPPAGTAPAPPAGIAPDPPASTLPQAAPEAEKGVRQDEAVALLRLAARLKAAHPSIDPSVVDQAVATARGSFRQAKVRTYVPILIERRVRVLLGALDREAASPVPAAVGDSTDTRPTTAGPVARPSKSPSRSPFLGRWIPARLRPAPASDLGRVGERP
ncbi:three-helix bundle dimerization domain-containing protein [Streptomyces sp. NPDC060027]|uniref:three-helix bundle dimerization domain-containing protein n=1 Tax=Streptomyces sp. NPDC060027 TaxID=3347040 RepID=UPI0036762ED7